LSSHFIKFLKFKITIIYKLFIFYYATVPSVQEMPFESLRGDSQKSTKTPTDLWQSLMLNFLIVKKVFSHEIWLKLPFLITFDTKK